MNNERFVAEVSLNHGDLVMQNHRVHDVSVLPGVVLVELVCRALHANFDEPGPIELKRILFLEPVVSAPGQDRVLTVTVSVDDGVGEVQVASARTATPDRMRTTMTAGLAVGESAGIGMEDSTKEWRPNNYPAPAPSARLEMKQLYQEASSQGIRHGAAMTCEGTVDLIDEDVLCCLSLVDRSNSGFLIHPAAFDASTIAAYGFADLGHTDPYIPLSIDRFLFERAVPDRFIVDVPAASRTPGRPGRELAEVSYHLRTLNGVRCASIQGLRCKRIRTPELITSLLALDGDDRTPVEGSRASAVIDHPGGSGLDWLAPAVIRWVANRTSQAASDIDTSSGFFELGLDSKALLALVATLEDWMDIELYPTLLFEHDTIDRAVEYLNSNHREAVVHGRRAEPAAPPGSASEHGEVTEPGSQTQVETGDDRATTLGWAQPGRVLDTRPVNQTGTGAVVVIERSPALAPRLTEAATENIGVTETPDVISVSTLADGLAALDRTRPGSLVIDLEAVTDDDLVEAIAALAGLRSEVDMIVVSDEPTGVADETDPRLAGLSALLRMVRVEQPMVRARPLRVLGSDSGTAVWRELRSSGPLPRSAAAVVSTPAEVTVECLIAADGPGGEDGFARLPEHPVCVVTGGTGGIGRALIDYLTTDLKATVLALGRRAPSDKLLELWRATGVTFTVCDVTDENAVKLSIDAYRRDHGSIDAVFHLAGVLRDGLMATLSPDDRAMVSAPKVDGFQALDSATADDHPVAFVCFSSMAAWLPGPGQGSYGSANATLDAMCRHRTKRGRPTISINWPLWKEGGMTMTPEEVDRSARSTGLLPLPTDEALTALSLAMSGRSGQWSVLFGERVDRWPIEDRGGQPVSGVPSVGAASQLTADVGAKSRSGAGRQPPPSGRDTDIAIVGAAGRYPGAESIEAYWKLLTDGNDAIEVIPSGRWNHDEIFDPKRGAQSKTYGRWGGFLRSMDEFDPAFFRISARDAERMDPQERLFLETAWALLEAAGHPAPKLDDRSIGVYVGVMWNHYQLVAGPDSVAPTAMHAAIANRVSYALDLSGPSMAVDTACSSSLTSILLAVDALRARSCSMAIAGGVNVSSHQQKYLQLAQGQFLSDDGRCRAFGDGATGYVPGEGVGAVLLRPLTDARRDGDDIWAVIRGGALNHSGRTGGFSVPAPAGQAEVIEAALNAAQVEPHEVTYVETHGTGTSLGDPIEIDGLGRAYGDGSDREAIAIGSSKSNIGHLEGAAGIAGLTKVLLQMRHRRLVPSLHADPPNPAIDFARSGFAVQTRTAPWSPDVGSVVAGLSGFGAGGSNAHLIIESIAPDLKTQSTTRDRHLLTLSARDVDGLKDIARRTADALRDPVDSRDDDGAPAASRALIAADLGLGLDDLRDSDTLVDLGLTGADLARVGLRLDDPSLVPGDFSIADVDRLLASGATGRSDLDRIAFTLQCRRSHLDERLAVIGDDPIEIADVLRRFSSGDFEDGRLLNVEPSAARLSGRPEASDELIKRASLWLAGDEVDFDRYWSYRPAAVHLPVPILRRQRFWLGQWEAGRRSIERGIGSSIEAPSSDGQDETGNRQAPPAVDAIADQSAVEVTIDRSGVALVTMTGVEHHNMFSDRLVGELEGAFSALNGRDDVVAIVVTGTESAFSLGGTPDTLRKLSSNEGSFQDASFLYEGPLASRVPVIAAIAGRAVGGGLTFGLHADLVVLDRQGTYAANFVKFGFTPGLAATHAFARWFGPALADEMCLTGMTYRGHELEARGAAPRFADSEDVVATAKRMAAAIGSRPAAAIEALKAERRSRVEPELAEIVARESEMHRRVLGDQSLRQIERVLPGLSPDRSVPNEPLDLGMHTDSADLGATSTPVLEPAPLTDQASEQLGARIKEVIESVLSAHLFMDDNEIDSEVPFNELGLDSLGAVEIVRDINEEFGLDLESVAVYEHSTVRALVAFAIEQLRAIDSEASVPERVSLGQSSTSPRVETEFAVDAGPEAATVPATLGASLTARVTPLDEEEALGRPTSATTGPKPLTIRSEQTDPAWMPTDPPAGVKQLLLRGEANTSRPEADLTEGGKVRLRPLSKRSGQSTPTSTAPGAQGNDRANTNQPDHTSDSTSESPADDAIAVVGMSARYPEAPNLDTFWQNLAAGRFSVATVPAERWDISEYYDPDQHKKGKTTSKWVGSVADIDRFDAAFFGISPREAELMDPQQRVFIEQAWRALEHAGYAIGPDRRLSCGVFVGTAAGDYMDVLREADAADSGQVFIGNSTAVLAGRIAYHLDLEGPTVALDTACSSSMVAVHLARQVILAGDCDMALAGGVALMVTPKMHVWNGRSGMLSPNGRCASFDSGADGFVLGEGCGVVVLKSLARARADRDHIYAVIRGTGINGDGRTNGITAPSADAQTRLATKVHRRAGVSADEIEYIETHGAGTQLGDPIEVSAIARALEGRDPDLPKCGIGSVKSNIGHTTLAAGVAGLIKVVLGLQHGLVPPSLHFSNPNPNIDFDSVPVEVVTTARPWRAEIPVAAVNSFGVSGTNSHAVVAAPDPAWSAASAEAIIDAGYIVPVSAKTASALVDNLNELRNWLSADVDLADLSLTLAVGRRGFRHRCVLLANDVESLFEVLDQAIAAEAPPQIAFPSGLNGPVPSADDPDQLPDFERPLDWSGLMAVARASLEGDFEWESFFDPRAGRRIAAPGHRLAETRYWISPSEPEEALVGRTRSRTTTRSNAPSVTTPTGDPDEHIDGRQWLLDHQVNGQMVLAGAAFLVEQLRRASGEATLVDVRWERPLRVANNTRVTSIDELVETRIEESASSSISSGTELAFVDRETGIRLARAEIEGTPPLELERPRWIDSDVDGLPRRLNAADLYQKFELAGIGYGPSYRLVEQIDHGRGRASAAVRVDGDIGRIQALDAVLQVVAALEPEGPTRLPQSLERIHLSTAAVGATVTVHVRRRIDRAYDLVAVGSDGRPVLTVDGFRLAGTGAKTYIPRWLPAPEPVLTGRSESTPTIVSDLDRPWLPGPGASVAGAEHYMVDLRRLTVDRPENLCGMLDQLRLRLIEVDDRRIGPVDVAVVTRSAVAVDDDPPPSPTQAALAAFVRSVGAEWSEWRVRFIDVDVETEPSLLHDQVVRQAPGQWPRLAHRLGRWLIPTVQPISLTETTPSRLSQPDAYLIVGGSGGLGRAVSRHLARAETRIGWIGRRPLDDDIEAAMDEIRGLGATVEYASADLADGAGLRTAVRSLRGRLGSFSGAFLSALDLDDGAIRKLDSARLERALRAKVGGVHNIVSALEAEPIDFLALFSSAVSLVDAPFQANYAAASAYLDAYGRLARQRFGTPVVVINWGFWGEVGAVTDQRYIDSMAARGVAAIMPSEGVRLLDRVLSNQSEQTLVLNADEDRFAEYGLTLASPATPASVAPPSSPSAEAAVGDPLASVPLHADAGGATIRSDAPIPANSGSAPSPDRSRLAQVVTDVFSEQLKLSVEDLDPGEPFDSYGVDSLLGMEILHQLEEWFGPLPSTLLYERLSIDEVVEGILETHSEEVAAVLVPDPPPPSLDAGPTPAQEPVPVPTGEFMSLSVTEPASTGTDESGVTTRPESLVASVPDERIAVVAMSGRFPGAADIEGFHRLLRSGGSGITTLPDERFAWRHLYDEDRSVEDRIYSTYGGFIDDVDRFDPGFFGILPREAAAIDPQERLFLEVCWDLLERAGHNGSTTREAETGVFVGTMYGSYGQIAAAAGWRAGHYGLGHSPYWSIANRVSYQLDFGGPSMTIDTACSSSLTAVHLACDAIRRGDCREAIVGGVNLILDPAHFVALCSMNMLGTGDGCRTFGKDADGFTPGEGVAAVLLKPLSEAVARGDDVLAVVAGSAVNAGGRTRGYTVPSPIAQAAVIQRALDRSMIAQNRLGYVEVHGTGTELGDPIEVAGLSRALSRSGGEPVRVGSVKSNIGHLEGAAGIGGLIKSVLQLRHAELFPTVGVESGLNPKIEFGQRVVPNLELTPWDRPIDGDGTPAPRAAGVSSFGAGGSNAHVVLEEAPTWVADPAGEGDLLFILSATNEAQLKSYAGVVAAWLRDTTENTPSLSPEGMRSWLESLCYTSQVGRRALPVRLAVQTDGIAGLAEELERVAIDRLSDRVAMTVDKPDPMGDLGVELARLLVAKRELGALGQAWIRGVNVSWDDLWPKPARLTNFPTVPLDRRRLWFESPEPDTADGATHPVPTSGPKAESGTLRSLAEAHRIGAMAIVPGAALLDRMLNETEPDVGLADVRWDRSVAIDDRLVEIEPISVGQRIGLRLTGDAGMPVISARPIGIPAAPANLVIGESVFDDVVDIRSGLELYDRFQSGGFEYGPKLRPITRYGVGPDGTVLAELLSTESAELRRPILIDGAFQLLATLHDAEPAVPVALDRYHQFGPFPDRVVVSLSRSDEGRFNLAIATIEGQPVANLDGVEVRAITPASMVEAATPSSAVGLTSRDGVVDRPQVDYLTPSWTLEPLGEPEPRRLGLIRCEYLTSLPAAALASEAMARELERRRLGGESDASTAAVVVAFHAGGNLLETDLTEPLLALRDLVERMRVDRNDGRHGDVELVVLAADRPSGAAMAGAVKSLAMENTWLTTRAIQVGDPGYDLTGEMAASTMAAVINEVVAGRAAEVRILAGQRAVRTLAPRPRPGPSQAALRPGGHYLLVGGAGGLGRMIAEHLLRSQPVHLSLVGRSEPTPELQAWMAGRTGDGRSMAYYRCEASDPDEVAKAVDRMVDGHGPICGAIFSAGAQHDGLAKNKLREDITAVVTAKTQGLVTIDRALAGQPLDFFAICSSLAGETGSLGQFDYAAANRYQIAYGEQRSGGSSPGDTITVAWPLWREGGMSVDDGVEQRFAQLYGMAPLDTSEGLEALDFALSGGSRQFALVQRPSKASASKPMAARPFEDESGTSRISLGPTVGEVEDVLRRIGAEFLLVEPTEVDIQGELLTLGFDSISVTNLTNRINDHYRLDLLPTVVFETGTLAALALYLHDHATLPADVTSTSPSSPNPTPAVDVESQHELAHSSNRATDSPNTATGPGAASAASAACQPGQLPGLPSPVMNAPAGSRAIAVIGMAGRFAGADSLSELWEALSEGRSLLGPAAGPDRRALLDDPEWVGIRGGFLSQVGCFDAAAFNISPREARLMDPQQRLFLETVYDVLSDAGYTKSGLEGAPVGVFAGVSTTDYDTLLASADIEIEPHVATGIAHSILANRVSYLQGWTGPSEAIDTACSSSLVAVHRAVSAMIDGECEMAVVGGVNVTLAPDLFSAFRQSGMLSPDYECRTFDADASGYVRGEGVGAVLLKPLDQALVDGDNVRAVIEGTAVNHSGRTASLTAPNPQAQANVISAAARRAGIGVSDLSYIEAHGTGTSLGDPIEIEGIKKALDGGSASDHELWIGAIKTNIGHLEAAAGIAGLLKTILCLEHRMLVTNRNFSQTNPHIRLAGTPLRLLTERRPLIDDQTIYAGVSSFGFGGTNAHVVVRSSPIERRAESGRSEPQVLMLSALTDEAMVRYLGDLAAFLGRYRPRLPDVAFTLATGREHHPKRCAVVAETIDDAIRAIETLAERSDFGSPVLAVGVDEVEERIQGAAEAWLAGDGVVIPTSGRRCSLPAVPLNRRRYWYIDTSDSETNGEGRPTGLAVNHRGAPPSMSAAGTAATPVVEPGDEPLVSPQLSSVESLPAPMVQLATNEAVRPAPASAGRQVSLAPVRSASIGVGSGPSAVSTTTGEVPTTGPNGRNGVLTEPGSALGPAPVVDDADHAGQGTAQVSAFIILELASILMMDPDGVDPSVDFSDLGLDSIFRMDLVRAVNDRFGLDLAAADLYEVRHAADLSDLVSTLVGGGDPAHFPADGGDLGGRGLPPTAEIDSIPESSEEIRGLTLAVLSLVQRLTDRDLSATTSFESAALTSFDMLRTIAALESVVGTLPKTLLFEISTPDTLAHWLHDRFGSIDLEPAGRIVGESSDLSQAEDEVSWGPQVIRKADLSDHPKESTIADLDQAHAKEGGLPGRDIAPYIYLVPDDSAYFNFTHRDGLLLAWSYVGSDEEFEPAVAAWADWAAERGLRVNLLSMKPLAHVGRHRFVAAPFGVVQRLNDIEQFDLKGSAKKSLRGRINRFTKAGEVSLEECKLGADRAIDASVVDMIDQWAARKEMVNSYVETVRREFAAGHLADRHRLFVTRFDGEIVNAVVITEIPSENGYLLDLEFFSDSMVSGGLDYAVAEIIKRTAVEGFDLFSFGATFGVGPDEDPDSPIADTLADLRTASLLDGGGNLQFKNKFGPTNLPIYLCRLENAPASEITSVVLLIADPPTIGAESTGDVVLASPVPDHSGIADDPDRMHRFRSLEGNGWNPLALASSVVDIDLLTDSWAELDLGVIERRQLEQAEALGALASDLSDQQTLPFRHLHAAPSGRMAERALLSAFGPNRSVIHNGLFPSWIDGFVDFGYSPTLIPPLVGSAEIDQRALERLLAESRPDLCVVELATNATGGKAIGLENLEAVAGVLGRANVPLILDATRAVGDCLLHDDDEPGFWARYRTMLGLATGITMSLPKEFGCVTGGLVGTDDERLTAALRQAVGNRGHEVGLWNRRLMGLALDDRAWVESANRERITNTRLLATRLVEGGVPVAADGAHAVVLSTAQLGLGHYSNPVPALLSWLFVECGVRAAPHFASGHHGLDRAVRLAVPVGFGKEEISRLAINITDRWRTSRPEDLVRLSSASTGLRFHPVTNVPDDVVDAVITGHTPVVNESWDVLSRAQPDVRRHLLDFDDGEVEVFEAGHGPALVFLHPFNIGAGFFGPQFSELADSHRTIVVHAPGAGATTAAADLSFAGLGNLVTDSVRRIGVSEPFVIVGASFGGLTAISMSRNRPDDVRGLVLLGSSYKVGNRKEGVNRLEVVAKADFDAVIASGNRELASRRNEMEKLLLSCETMNPEIGLRYLDVFAEKPELLADAAQLHQPTLLLHGVVDTVIAPSIAEKLAETIPTAELIMVDGAGHFPSLTSPQVVNDEVRRYVEGLA